MWRERAPVTAKVRGLVPAIAGRDERVDDELEIALHRLRLSFQLLAVFVRETRSRFRFQLVAREVLGAEGQSLVEIPFEVGGLLAGDPVDEIEADVVKAGITQMVERSPDVLRPGAPVENVEEARLKRFGRRARPGSRLAP